MMQTLSGQSDTFKPQVDNMNLGQTTGEFTVITPF